VGFVTGLPSLCRRRRRAAVASAPSAPSAPLVSRPRPESGILQTTKGGRRARPRRRTGAGEAEQQSSSRQGQEVVIWTKSTSPRAPFWTCGCGVEISCSRCLGNLGRCCCRTRFLVHRVCLQEQCPARI
jgi:hypothetical protein